MTGAELLRLGAGSLRLAGIDDAEIEAEILLRHALGVSRAHLFTHAPGQIGADDERRFRALLAKRARHIPSAYLTGLREFYDLELAVGPGVLIPRPETEHLVEEALRIGRKLLAVRDRMTVVDVGTGSGAVALAVAKHLPAARVLATDISPAALAQAEYNAKRLRLAGRVTFLAGDLLDAVHEPVDLVLANLPYISSGEIAGLQPEVRDHEPRAALDGGPDGLRLIARLLGQLPGRLCPGGAAILEIGHDQAELLRPLIGDMLPGAELSFVPDLAGIERVAVIRP